ncbi:MULTISPECIES: RagB/SusD family nutrient uptake outer membrane protein [Proteiniphilum]|uniref:RagB/SusD family nutrient uptake outer membrane protein n=1 Tax=Proteiniphilum TaxID=294702 RepID=UPI00035EAEE3|nr:MULTISPECIES: RagB/SusD family nutrient uptake outer membrane protein [Proteiniphilum]RNC64136.1 RagB/SusD family nutrient uptake outer membrane protein [Proteiniphilum sp. X52]SFL50958.1 Starch-binding associating with outer membrane [Porphyromonadaceae bacterium KH3CP3RA]
MKIKNIFVALAIILFSFNSCSDFLEREPDTILSDDQIFGDAVMIKSVLSNFYGRITWGQHIDDSYPYTILDEASKSDGGPDTRQDFENDRWRVYDYTLLRNLNQFLKGVRASTVLDDETRNQLEGEARFIRAWLYFNMGRGMGGMPIIGDEVFEYTPGMDITTMQYARSTEAGLYDYIISECEAIKNFLPTDPSTNAARATKWAALMLKARAAVYAGSIANYNNKMTAPVRTTGEEVGIPADLAAGYYGTALAAAEEVIASGKYELQLTKPDDRGRNFYEALSVKENNKEVIWARDYKYPGQTNGFTQSNIPASHAEDIDRAYAGPILNLVEDFEYINDRNGQIRTKEANGDYVYYDNPEDAFANKDPRLWGTVIYPGAIFKGTPVVLQAGQKYLRDGKWEIRTSEPGERDNNDVLITSVNGPTTTNNQFVNKSGFFFRKFMDETPSASTRGRRSEMWFPRFRIAEAYMIASEAALELGQSGKALTYINAVRNRAGIQELATVTFNDIVRERRVEFAFEDHRYWDLKRWRLAHQIWNGNGQNEYVGQQYAQQMALFPYLINDPGNPNNGKWVFDKFPTHMSPYPRRFEMRNYYNFIDQGWINNNPKLVKNPYQ